MAAAVRRSSTSKAPSRPWDLTECSHKRHLAGTKPGPGALAPRITLPGRRLFLARKSNIVLRTRRCRPLSLLAENRPFGVGELLVAAVVAAIVDQVFCGGEATDLAALPV